MVSTLLKESGGFNQEVLDFGAMLVETRAPHTCVRCPGFSSYCCPYGGFLAVPAVFSGFAMFFTWGSSIWCSFFRVESADLASDLGNTTWAEREIGVGIWTIEDILRTGGDDDDECMDYPNAIDVDGPMKFGRAMSSISALLGLIGFVMILVPSCVKMNQIYMKIVAGSFFCMFVITMLTLVRAVN